MNKPARLTRRERKEQKIAEQVAKRIEEANKPLPAPPRPTEGTLRYNYANAQFEAYLNGKWINMHTVAEQQP